MKKSLYLLLFTFSTFCAFGQKPSDLELWTGGSFQLRINKPLSIDVTEQFRFNKRISSLNESLTELGVKYRVGKGFSFRGSYRHSVNYGKGNDHRLAMDANYGFDKKGFPLQLDYRMRFQHVLGGNATYLRNKFSVTYKLSKLVDPYAAFELFFRFNGKNEFRKTRYTIGLDWRLLKDLHMSTYFRLQDDINIKKPERKYIIGCTFDYTLKLKKKKKTASSI